MQQTALIGPLALALIDQALGQLVTWQRLGIDVQMSVNLSARNLIDAELPQQIAEILERHRVAALTAMLSGWREARPGLASTSSATPKLTRV